MPLMIHLLPTLFGFKAIERMVDDPWTPPPSLLNALMRQVNPNPPPEPKDHGEGQ